jgi:5-methylcytosine-specific restriction endonuclease McrA
MMNYQHSDGNRYSYDYATIGRSLGISKTTATADYTGRARTRTDYRGLYFQARRQLFSAENRTRALEAAKPADRKLAAENRRLTAKLERKDAEIAALKAERKTARAGARKLAAMVGRLTAKVERLSGERQRRADQRATKAERDAVFARDGYTCVFPLHDALHNGMSTRVLSVDHADPHAEDRHDTDGMQTLCGCCHLYKTWHER